MATRKSSPAPIQIIDTSAMEEYASPRYVEKLYPKVYYSLQNLVGISAQNRLGASFSWNTLKERFKTTFGTPEEPKYSLEQLLQYAQEHFGKSLEDLLDANERSWERRKARKEQLAHPVDDNTY